MSTFEERLDAVDAITSCYQDRRVLWELREEDTPQECTNAARELKKLADAIRMGHLAPSLNAHFLGISRSARIFITGGYYTRAYAADATYFATQRRVLKESLMAVFKELSDVVIPGTGDWAADA